MVKYGLSSWDEKTPKFNGKNTGPKIPFIKLKNGNNVLRIITAPYKYQMVRFKPSPDTKGFGERINCSEPLESCPTRAAGFFPKERCLVGAIDRSDNLIKIYDFSGGSQGVLSQLQSWKDDIEWGDPVTYDITVKKNPDAGPSGYYIVLPRGKTPLSQSDEDLIAQAGDNLTNSLARLTTAPSAETVLKKMQEFGYTGGIVNFPKEKTAKPELADVGEDEYSFNGPAAQAN